MSRTAIALVVLGVAASALLWRWLESRGFVRRPTARQALRLAAVGAALALSPVAVHASRASLRMQETAEEAKAPADEEEGGGTPPGWGRMRLLRGWLYWLLPSKR